VGAWVEGEGGHEENVNKSYTRHTNKTPPKKNSPRLKDGKGKGTGEGVVVGESVGE
jgi:hypothetical protein